MITSWTAKQLHMVLRVLRAQLPSGRSPILLRSRGTGCTPVSNMMETHKAIPLNMPYRCQIFSRYIGPLVAAVPQPVNSFIKLISFVTLKTYPPLRPSQDAMPKEPERQNPRSSELQIPASSPRSFRSPGCGTDKRCFAVSEDRSFSLRARTRYEKPLRRSDRLVWKSLSKDTSQVS